MKRALVLLFFACGPSGSLTPLRDDHRCLDCPDAQTIEAGPMGIPNEPLESWDTTNAGPVTGIFAVEAVITAHAGPTVTLRQLLRLRIVQQGNKVHEKTTLCAFKLPEVPGTATLRIPPALQSVIQTKGAEEEGEFLQGTGTLKYVPPPFLVVVGAGLANPATDPLPTAMDLSKALDEDKDGDPGVTLGARVFTCPGDPPPFENLFVALRTSGLLTGTVPSPDLITGKVDVKFADSVLGYSNECLSAAAMLEIDVEPGSPFKALRTTSDDDIDRNGNVSCAEIVLRAPTTFGPEWNPE